MVINKTATPIIYSIFSLVISVFLVSMCFTPKAYAESYSVKYLNGAEDYIADTMDLFDHFGELMPGDTASGELELNNSSDNKINIYFFTELGDSNRESAKDLFKEIKLTITHSGELIYEGDLEGAELNDAILLSTLNPGESSKLVYEIEVPTTLNNKYELAENTVIWNFQAQEAEDNKTDIVDKNPGDNNNGGNKSDNKGGNDKPNLKNMAQTGDNLGVIFMLVGAAVVISIIILLVASRNKGKEQGKDDDC